MTGRWYYLGAPAGALDQGRHILGASQHVVVRSGYGGTPQEVTDILQMLVEIFVDLVPHRRPEGIRTASVHYEILSLYRSSCSAVTEPGHNGSVPASSILRTLPNLLPR